MKLPIYQRQVGPGGVPGGGGLSLGAATLPSRAMADVGGAVQDTAQAIGEVERKIEHSASLVQAAKLSGEFETFLSAETDKLSPERGGIDQNVDAFRKAGEAWLQSQSAAITNPIYRNAITAQLTNHLTQAAAAARAETGKRIVVATQNEALQQMDAIAKKGTPDALAEAHGFIQGLTDAGIFAPQRGAEMKATAEKDITSNYFAGRVQADPAGTFKELTENRFPFQIDNETRDRYLTLSKNRVQYEEDRERQKELQRRQDEAYAEHRVKQEVDKIEERAISEISVVAMTDPRAAMQLLVAYGPDGDDMIRGHRVPQIIKEIPSIYTATSERTDPAVYQDILQDFANESPRYSAADVARRAGLSMQDKRMWAASYQEKSERDANRAERRAEREENKALRDAHRAEAEEDRDLQAVFREIDMSVSVARQSQDPAAIDRATRLAATTIQSAMGAVKYRGGEGVMSWWRSKGQQPFENALGQDADRSVAGWESMLPEGVRTREDLAAYQITKGWSDTHPESRRLTRILMNADRARGFAGRMKQQKSLAEDVRKGREAVRQGKPPGSLNEDLATLELYNAEALSFMHD